MKHRLIALGLVDSITRTNSVGHDETVQSLSNESQIPIGKLTRNANVVAARYENAFSGVTITCSNWANSVASWLQSLLLATRHSDW
jgi:TPP-dependent trihydroxycyclohexane-1,2-dione (THcHDO) dehydratase